METFRKRNFVAAFFFLVILCVPLVGFLFPGVNVKPVINEQRQLAERPVFEITDVANFAEKFESYFNDHFGCRNLMIKANNWLKYKLGSSEFSKVSVGRDSWLYYTPSLDHYRVRFSDEELVKWKKVLEEKQRRLADKGIVYLFIVAPNKASIYPEFLQEGTSPKLETPLDQLVTYLELNSEVNVLDLRTVLIQQKDKGLLYYKNDTHWTSLGAFLAYEKIIAHLSGTFPNIVPLTFDDVKSVTKSHNGDLARMIGLQEEIRELVEDYQVDGNFQVSLSVSERPNAGIRTVSNNKALPRLLMFRDSFGAALIPFLSVNFSHADYISGMWRDKQPIDQNLEETEPNIVIEELVERAIHKMKFTSL